MADPLDHLEGRVLSSSLRADRVLGERGNVQDDVHYNSTYGTTLSDAQAKALDAQQNTFLSEMSSAKDKISKAQSEGSSVYNSEKERLAALLGSVPEGWDSYYTKNRKDMTGTMEWVPNDPLDPAAGYTEKDISAEAQARADMESRDQYNQFFKETAGSNYHEAYNNFLKNSTKKVLVTDGTTTSTFNMYTAAADEFANKLIMGNFYGVTTQPDGSYVIHNKGYGQELITPIIQHQQELETAFIDKYKQEVEASGNQSLSDLEGQYSQLNRTLAQRQKEIQGYEDLNTQSLNAIRAKYAQKLSDIKGTIGSLING